MKYDLTDLRVFLAVVDARNLSRGAERCHLAPSSVSLRIKNLEEAFGTPLLLRRSRGVRPTAAGQILAEHARRCLAHLEQMHADLMPFSKGITGHVTLFANNNAISSFLPEDLTTFFETFPSVRITMEERMSHEIVAAVADGRADVGVVVFDGSHPELKFLPYRNDRLVLIAPPQINFGGRSEVAFAECLRHPFVCLQQGAAMHTFLVNHAASLGSKLDVRVQVSGYGAIARLVASGAGVGVIPASAVQPAHRKSMQVVSLSDPWARRDLRICLKQRPLAVNHFRDELVSFLTGSRRAS